MSDRFFFNRLDFKQQLIIAFTAGVIVLALATCVALAVITNKSLRSQIIDQAVYLTDSVARQSRLALLYQSQTAAKDTADIALQFPDVVGVTIITETGELLYSEGEAKELDISSLVGPSETTMTYEDDRHLVFLSPVETDVDSDQETLWDVDDEDPEAEASTGEVLGYVSLTLSKSSLNAMSSKILQGNIGTSLAVSVFLLLFLLFLARRMTKPLTELSRVMNKAEAGEEDLRASLEGPRDIEEMQKAFNTMMTALETRSAELRKARDAALESAEIKSLFAANVSHELRTPMNSVLGMLDLLSVMGLNRKQYDYTETAKMSAQNLLALIDDILSYVHADSGNIIIEPGPCNINDLLEDVMNLMATQAMRKGLDLGYLIEPGISTVLVDNQRLRQILINLIGNAVKFTDSGEVSVVVQRDKDDSNRLHFLVRDTGVGITAESREKIFDAFTQGDSTTTKKYGGTGLGLAICKQFVTLMDGEIDVQSVQGTGSEFHLMLPCPSVKDDQAAIPEFPNLDSKRVLIADDSRIVRDFSRQWLASAGAEVTAARSAMEVLSQLNDADKKQVAFDYLFVDENIQGVNLADLLHLAGQHTSSKNAETIIFVNPWTINHENELSDCLIIEKPVFQSKLLNFFNAKEGDQGRDRISAEKRARLIPRKIHKNVLVVDDNHANRLVAGGMLEQIGSGYEFAHNGKEAIDKVSRKSYDLVLMDCNMPVMDGYEATKTIRKLESDARSLPIVAMTANNSAAEKNACENAGMDDFIAKPLSVDMLHRVLTHWLDGKELGIGKEQPDSLAEISTGSFDREVVERLRSSVGEVFTSVVDAFLEDVPMYLQSLKAAISREDKQQVYELSHTVKGSAANFGAHRVSALAKKLESRGQRGDLLGSDKLFGELNDECIRLVNDIKNYMQGVDDGVKVRKEGGDKAVILVADDDRAMRLAFSNALRDEGYRILEATNGQSTLALCARSMPDLILIDAIMPELDGFSACRQIREMPNGTDVPILMVTSLEDEQSISRAFVAGATDYITKPANFSVLRQRVSRLLQTSKVERHVRELAYQDVLTGLPNRAYFNQQLRHKISRANLKNRKMAILFLDLDRFKLINDSLGHDAGDLILKAAGERINRCVRKNDLVARLGGDEFTIVLEDIESREVAGEISRKICESLNTPFVFLKQKMFVSASIGVCIFPEDGTDIRSLLKHADTAMFKAKEAQIDYCFYQSGMEDEVNVRVETERDLRAALEQGQFEVYYQSQMDVATNKIAGVEALVRWLHPERGLLSAGEFITVAEEAGLIGELGSLVFRQACHQLKQWYEQGVPVRVAVNVSGGEFQDGRLRHQVFSLLDELDFPPQLLEVEITETMLMDQPALAQSELSALRDRGVSIAIDDFGSGFSSLNYLKRFAVDVLKIDREFVKDCDADKNDRAIISGIVTLAKSLDLKVVAEGVETQEQIDFLRTAGCDYVQGYYYGKPEPADKMTARINYEVSLEQST